MYQVENASKISLTAHMSDATGLLSIDAVNLTVLQSRGGQPSWHERRPGDLLRLLDRASPQQTRVGRDLCGPSLLRRQGRARESQDRFWVKSNDLSTWSGRRLGQLLNRSDVVHRHG
jgi:hypothetical protein